MISEYRKDNVLEKLAGLIPGYKGYSERNGRRETDKILRMHISSTLHEKSSLSRALIEQHRLESLGVLEQLKTKTILIADSIRYAQGGASGIFDWVKVDNAVLADLYLYDLKLKEYCDHLLSNIENLSLMEIDKCCEPIHCELDDLQGLINKRTNIITGVK